MMAAAGAATRRARGGPARARAASLRSRQIKHPQHCTAANQTSAAVNQMSAVNQENGARRAPHTRAAAPRPSFECPRVGVARPLGARCGAPCCRLCIIHTPPTQDPHTHTLTHPPTTTQDHCIHAHTRMPHPPPRARARTLRMRLPACLPLRIHSPAPSSRMPGRHSAPAHQPVPKPGHPHTGGRGGPGVPRPAPPPLPPIPDSLVTALSPVT